MRLRGFKTWTEIVRNVVEVVALVVAGWWAYQHFAQTELPLLARRLQYSSEMTWAPTPTSTHCLAQFGVSVKNIGKVDVVVTRGVLRVWMFPFPDVKEGTALLYLDAETLKGGRPPDIERPLSTLAGVVGRYRPDAGYGDTHTFLVPRRPGMIVFVSLLLFNDKDVVVTLYRWDSACGETPAIKSG